MTFNQQLIEKARKGEIAILNDGSVEELTNLLKYAWPKDSSNEVAGDWLDYKYYFQSIAYAGYWARSGKTELPAHSVKDFIMNTTDSETLDNTVQQLQPRTYRVTRQQMGQIDEARASGTTTVIREIMGNRFSLFANEAELTDTDVSLLNSIVPDVDILKGIFPEYFYIPEGEPVLYKCDKHAPYRIGVSNGNGHVFLDHQTTGLTLTVHCVIPFTKNPQS